MAATVLLVEDDPTLRRALTTVLERRGYTAESVATAEEGLKVLEEGVVDVVVTDIVLPGMDGLELLQASRRSFEDLPVVVMSGAASLASAAEAIKLGAVDFLEKPIGAQRLLLTLENVLRLESFRVKADELEKHLGAGDELIGDSESMVELRKLIAKVGPSDGRVLILGENGTGKELVANALHRASARADEPLVKLNCAAVPGELVESELFGHEKGAFTGAARARRGRFEEADGGTLFLDEVGDMPLPMQAKLLRVLQEGTVERVGSDRTLNVDVRVLAATNRDPQQMVEDGTFREDLYYRLNVVTLEVPPLRERPGDIGPLARSFANAVAARMSRRPVELSDDAIEALARHRFPGNVRELRNIVERLTILADDESIGRAEVEKHVPTTSSDGGLYRPGVPLKELVRDAERRIIEAAIADHDGNKSATARDLEVDRSHFYKKCGQLGLGDD